MDFARKINPLEGMNMILVVGEPGYIGSYTV